MYINAIEISASFDFEVMEENAVVTIELLGKSFTGSDVFCGQIQKSISEIDSSGKNGVKITEELRNKTVKDRVRGNITVTFTFKPNQNYHNNNNNNNNNTNDNNNNSMIMNFNNNNDMKPEIVHIHLLEGNRLSEKKKANLFVTAKISGTSVNVEEARFSEQIGSNFGPQWNEKRTIVLLNTNNINLENATLTIELWEKRMLRNPLQIGSIKIPINDISFIKTENENSLKQHWYRLQSSNNNVEGGELNMKIFATSPIYDQNHNTEISNNNNLHNKHRPDRLIIENNNNGNDFVAQAQTQAQTQAQIKPTSSALTTGGDKNIESSSERNADHNAKDEKKKNNKKLSITLMSGKGIKGHSAYCVISAKSLIAAGDHNGIKTSTVKYPAGNPSWSFDFNLAVSSHDLLVIDVLEDSIHPSQRPTFYGQCMIPLDTITLTETNEKEPKISWYPLHERKRRSRTLYGAQEIGGEIQLSFMISYVKDADNNTGEKEIENSKRRSVDASDGDEEETTFEGPGSLEIWVLEATDLLAKDIGGTSDPYCEVAVDETSYKTKIIKKTLDPTWTEMFNFRTVISNGNASTNNNNNLNPEIVVRVFDWDRIGSHDFLGECRISLKSLTNQKQVEQWYKLFPGKNYHQNDAVKGKIKLKLKFTALIEEGAKLLKVSKLEIERKNSNSNSKSSASHHSLNHFTTLSPALMFHIICGENLSNESNENPYCEARIANSVITTQYISKTGNPLWNKKGLVHVLKEDELPHIAMISVKNHRFGGGFVGSSFDNTIGSCIADLRNSVDKKEHIAWVNLDERKDARIQIRYQYTNDVETLQKFEESIQLQREDQMKSENTGSLSPSHFIGNSSLSSNNNHNDNSNHSPHSGGNSIGNSGGGLLYVEVVEARGLYAANKSGKDSGTSDPYCVLAIGNGREEQKTPVISETVNPTWKESFFNFHVRDTKEKLNITIYDYNKWSSKTFLGDVSIPVHEQLFKLQSNTFTMDKWFPLGNMNSVKINSNNNNNNNNNNNLNVPGLGDVRLRLRYTMTPETKKEVLETFNQLKVENKSTVKDSGRFLIHVIEAKGLFAADRNGTSDPYVIIKYGNQSKISSKIYNTLAPVWNEYIAVDALAKDVMMNIVVMDYNKLTDKEIGITSLSYDHLINLSNLNLNAGSNNDHEWIDLKPGKDVTNTSSVGKIRLNVKMASTFEELQELMKKTEQSKEFHQKGAIKGGTLLIRVIEARGLPAADSGGTSDPFVEISVMNKQHSSHSSAKSQKTKIIDKTLNPVWDEILRYHDIMDLVNSQIAITVYDHDKFALSNDFLGEYVISDMSVYNDEKIRDIWLPLSKQRILPRRRTLSNASMSIILPSPSALNSSSSSSTGFNLISNNDSNQVMDMNNFAGEVHLQILFSLSMDVNEKEFGSAKGIEVIESKITQLYQQQQQQQQQQKHASSSSSSITSLSSLAHGLPYGRLLVDIIEAQGLRSADSNGFSDPFCVVTLGKQKFKTQVVKKSLDPIWNHQGVLDVTAEANNILITVFDEDLFGARYEYLGEVSIPISSLDDMKVHDEWYQLNNGGGATGGAATPSTNTSKFISMFTIGNNNNNNSNHSSNVNNNNNKDRSNITVTGKIHCKLQHAISRETISAVDNLAKSSESRLKSGNENGAKLTIKIVEARNLKAADRNGLSDPFCVLKLGNNKSAKEQFKTNVVMECLDPKWNETTSLMVHSITDALIVEIRDWNKIKSSVLLGTVTIPLQNSDIVNEMKPIDKWYNLKDECGEVRLIITYSLPKEAAASNTNSATAMIKGLLSVHGNSSQDANSTTNDEINNNDINLNEDEKEFDSDDVGMKGSLFLHVIEAQNLISADANGFSDPFCVIRSGIGSQIQKTEVKMKTLNPVWNSQMNVDMSFGSKIYVFIKDWDRFSSSDLLGKCVIDVSLLKPRVYNEGWYDLEQYGNMKKVSGKIKLRMKYFPDGADEILDLEDDTRYSTQLHQALIARDKLAAMTMISEKAILTRRDKYGYTVLQWACFNHIVEVVSLLLENHYIKQARIETPDDEGNTPLHTAASRGFADIVKLLIERGKAMVNVKNRKGATALIEAAIFGYHECVEYLLSSRATKDAVDGRGMMALHWACFHDHRSVVKLLVDAGCDLDVKDNAGYSSRDYIRLRKSKLLQDYL